MSFNPLQFLISMGLKFLPTPLWIAQILSCLGNSSIPWGYETIMHSAKKFKFLFFLLFYLPEIDFYIRLSDKDLFLFHKDKQLFQKTLFNSSSVPSNV